MLGLELLLLLPRLMQNPSGQPGPHILFVLLFGSAAAPLLPGPCPHRVPSQNLLGKGSVFFLAPGPAGRLEFGHFFLKKLPGKFTRGDAEDVLSAFALGTPRSQEGTQQHSAPYRSEARSAISAAPPAKNSRLLELDSQINSVRLTVSSLTFEDLGQGAASLGAAAGQ